MRRALLSLLLVPPLLALASCEAITGAPVRAPTCYDVRRDYPTLNAAGDTVSTFTVIYPVCTPRRAR